MERSILVVFFSFVFSISSLFAAPAAPIETTVSQPDGTIFTVRARGDEHYNWMETSGGHTIVKQADTWFYARNNDNGGLEASNSPVGSLNAIEVQQLPLHLMPATIPTSLQRNVAAPVQQHLPHSDGDLQFGAILQPNNSVQRSQLGGVALAQAIPHTQYVLTILVSYTDVSITSSTASFQSLMYGASDSVKDFFLENSYNGFTVTAPNESQGTANDGLIHVSRPVVHPNQGLGNNGTVSRSEARLIVQLADPFIDYAAYDANGDGELTADELAIVIIAAGYETSYGGNSSLSPNVWGHKWQFASDITLDGTSLSPYTMFGENHGVAGSSHQATIGIMCHELGHLMLDLPDLYDIDASQGSEGIGNWGLMGGGSWNVSGGFAGNSPAHLSAWSKVTTSFTIPEDIDIDQSSVSIPQAETNQTAKRLWIDKYKLNEYFLIENRQKTAYDAGLPGSGLLIWHIDENQSTNGDENHKLVDLEEADGFAHLDDESNRGDSGDAFPGSSSNATFNNVSNPNSQSYTGTNTGIAVTSISASSSNMTADLSSLAGGVGDHVRYDEDGIDAAAGLGTTTAWLGLRVQNDTGLAMLDGIEIFVLDAVGATIDVQYYSNMTNGIPSGLIYEQTGIAAGPFWNRLLFNTPQLFPAGTERGIVVKVVNDSGFGPIVNDASGAISGRSYYSDTGTGAFLDLEGDLGMAALLSGVDEAPVFTAAASVSPMQGSPEIGSVDVGTASDAETSNGSLSVSQITGGSASGVTVSNLVNTDGNLTASFAASCTATSGTVRFEVSDGNQTSTGDLQVDVAANTLPVFSYSTKPIDFAQSGSHSTATGPSDNGSVELLTLNSAGAFTGGITLSQAGVVSIANAQPVGDHTVSLTARDNCDADTSATFSLQVNAVVPDAPTIGVAQASNGTALVHFTPPTFTGGEPVGFYSVSSSAGGLPQTGSGSPVEMTGLTNGQAYTFSVVAVNSAGNSSASASSNSVVPIGPQTITFDNPGSQDFGTAPILGASASSGLTVAFSTSSPAVCAITTDGLLTFLTVGVCSVNVDQAGDEAHLPATTVNQSFDVVAVVPGAPLIGVATADDEQATVTFSEPAFEGGATISSYTVTSVPGGLTADGNSSPLTVTGLTNGQAYVFTVTATNVAGVGSASAASNSVTPIASQTITFDNPGDQDFGTTPTLSATATSGLTVEFSSTTPSVCVVTAGGMLGFVSVGNCSINANQAGDEAWLEAQTVTHSFPVNAVLPGAPIAVSAIADNAEASISFSAPDFDGGASISLYTVTSAPEGIIATGTSSPITVPGLTNGQTYTFTVTASNSVGDGVASAESNPVTPTDEFVEEIFIDGFE